MKPYYQDGAVTIYHGDCREILPGLPKVDLVLTDPPYEIYAGAGGGCFGRRDHLVKTGGFTDVGCDFAFLLGFSDWFCFCSRLQLQQVLSIATKNDRWNLLTWCKPNPVPTCSNKYLPDVEYVVHSFSTGRLFGTMALKSSFMLHPCGDKTTEHPNKKPFRIVSKLVRLGSVAGDTILDPFMGSGTTLRAAKDLGRKAIGIEIEERYCAIAAKRMQQECLPLTSNSEISRVDPVPELWEGSNATMEGSRGPLLGGSCEE
jgi:site-specific DNA-methyltransferase (adenine-specific)